MTANQNPHEGLSENQIVRELVADPTKPSAKRFTGYVGRSDRPRMVRLYPTLSDLSYFYELPEEALLRVEPAVERIEAKGAVHLWVNGETDVVYREPTRELKFAAKFLRGAILQDHLRIDEAIVDGSVAPGDGRADMQPNTGHIPCKNYPTNSMCGNCG